MLKIFVVFSLFWSLGLQAADKDLSPDQEILNYQTYREKWDRYSFSLLKKNLKPGIDLSSPPKSGKNQPYIILTSEAGYDESTLLFEIGTYSRWGHCGILYYDDVESQWMVAHATPTVARVQSIQSFLSEYVSINRANHAYALTILELRNHSLLDHEQVDDMYSYFREIREERIYIPYNYEFIVDENLKDEKGTMCCSEFIYRVFQKYGINAGVEEDKSSPYINASPSWIPGLGGLIANVLLPLRGKTVSPASIARSKNLKLVHSNVPLVASEREIIEAWKNSLGSECQGESCVSAFRFFSPFASKKAPKWREEIKENLMQEDPSS